MPDHGHGHGHGRGHGHVHHAPAGRGRRGDRLRLLGALGIYSVLCAAEVVGGLMSQSLALISDAGHMLSDLLGEGLALLALLWAERPAGPRRTFGYHRVEILMALLQGALLFALASGVIWFAIGRLSSPPEVHTGIMLAVAGVGLLANVACALLLRGGHSLNVRGAYLHVLLDGLSSVAVLLAGLLMAAHRGLYVLDPILSIGIGLFIYYGAYRLAAEAVQVLLEAAPEGLDPAEIGAGLRELSGITDVHDLHVWTITSGMTALSAHLLVACDSVADNDAILGAAKQLLRERFHITHSTLQIEAVDCGDREKVC